MGFSSSLPNKFSKGSGFSSAFLLLGIASFFCGGSIIFTGCVSTVRIPENKSSDTKSNHDKARYPGIDTDNSERPADKNSNQNGKLSGKNQNTDTDPNTPNNYNEVVKAFGLEVVSSFKGTATYYADSFQDKPTSSGELYKKSKFTAAHKDLPFNTLVRVTNLKNGKTVIVKINDRGPFVKEREIDLSYIAAKAIDMLNDGVVEVLVEILGKN
ncbi:MAG: septal ring lytic transglycosylase RlpA family protein [Ignavibacteriales bacterium]|nr:MAG: septal ring lytic transglycosylase RlpA family protein [Ignavibacteriaceae bacterium]MBW7873622.1 septal ring lytic transglycosylase RlpA family protein [Ignavibacteria bacterium]MCZ2143852.1 septal ring lytic transglycosylase RlpA family protein [Ignavibacteriales bacterium]OQY79362.1 MAG: hypothetical protein B6D45_00915 [Ignavibacteriales bacterium UTCHB3]MBV6445877.1 hypothetical protein [Ignavibacteriaceae bacterium]